MIRTQDQKVVQVIAPAAIVDNASWTTTEIDTLGFDYCDIYFMLGATDIALAALKLQESDTAGSGHADIDGADFATDGDGVPSATEDNGIYAIHVNLAGPRKRYLDLVATGGDGTAGAYATAWAVLSRAKESPNSVTERGLTEELFV